MLCEIAMVNGFGGQQGRGNGNKMQGKARDNHEVLEGVWVMQISGFTLSVKPQACPLPPNAKREDGSDACTSAQCGCGEKPTTLIPHATVGAKSHVFVLPIADRLFCIRPAPAINRA